MIWAWKRSCTEDVLKVTRVIISKSGAPNESVSLFICSPYESCWLGKYRCSDELFGKFFISRGFGCELMTFYSIPAREINWIWSAGWETNQFYLAGYQISFVSCWETGPDNFFLAKLKNTWKCLNNIYFHQLGYNNTFFNKLVVRCPRKVHCLLWCGIMVSCQNRSHEEGGFFPHPFTVVKFFFYLGWCRNEAVWRANKPLPKLDLHLFLFLKEGRDFFSICSQKFDVLLNWLFEWHNQEGDKVLWS